MDDATIRIWLLARYGTYNRISALVLLLWDFVVNFENERKLFWNKPCTLATVLFLWSRYVAIGLCLFGAVVTLLPNPTVSVCYGWLVTEGWLGLSTCLSVQVILQLRIYAIYDRSRELGWFLVTSFFCQISAIAIVLANAKSGIGEVVVEKAGNLTRCGVATLPNWIWVFWLTLVIFEAILCFLAVRKGVERVRCSNNSLYSVAGLEDILIRDSVIYFIGIILVYVTNFAIWANDLPYSLDTATAFAIAYPSLMGSHMMMNVRHAHYKPLMLLRGSPSDISLPGTGGVSLSDR